MDDFFARAPGRRHRLHDRRAQGARRARPLRRDVHRRATPRARPSCARTLAQLPGTRSATAPGVAEAEIERFAAMYGGAKRAVLLYSMGLTQYAFGVDNVKMVVNLALARGNLGREKTGIIPIRGHSGVQGTAECGVDSDKLPGGVEHQRRELRALRGGVGPPDSAPEGAARRRTRSTLRRESEIDLLYPRRRQLPRHHARPGERAARAGERRAAHPPGHRAQHLDAGRRRGAGARVAGADPLRVGRHVDVDRAAHPLLARDPAGHDRRGAAGVGDPGAHRPRAEAREARSFPTEHGADVRARWRACHAALRRHRGAREGRGLGAVGRRAPGRERLSQHARRPRALLDRARSRASTCPAGKLMLTTRRGKQFNSITYGQKDPISAGAPRETALHDAEDMQRWPRRRRPRAGAQRRRHDGRDRAPGPCRRRHVQAFWPESNVCWRACTIPRRASPTTRPS